MSLLSTFSGGGPTSAVINAFSSGGALAGVDIRASVNTNGAKSVLSGALTAATLATALSVTGAGDVPLLSVAALDVTSRTLRMKVTVDGTVVFDATSSASTLTGNGIWAAGKVTSVGNFVPSTPIRFNASLLVEIASSLTETDKLSLAYVLYKR